MKGKFVQEKGEHNALIKSLMKHFKKDEEELLDEDQEELSEAEDKESLPKHLREIFMKSKKYRDEEGEDSFSGEYDAEDSLKKSPSLSEEDDEEEDYDVEMEDEEEDMPDRADKETRKKMVIALMKKGM